MSFLFRSLTATFCFSWYAHIVAILHRKTYLIQPVIQLSKLGKAPQGVVSGVRGEYPTSKNVFHLFLSLTNWRISWEFGKKLFSVLTFNCWLFWGNGQIIFLFRLKTACYQGFIPSLVPNEVGQMDNPFSKRILHPKTKNSRKPFIYGIFRLKKYFEIFLKFIEKRVKICYNDKRSTYDMTVILWF